MVTAPATELDLVGGDPALDFANTLAGPRGAEPEEDFLSDYGELVAWSACAGVLDEATADRLAATAQLRPDDADRAFAAARRLRAAVVAVFGALAQAEAPPPHALGGLTAFHADALRRARLEPAGRGFDFAWDSDDLESVLSALALSAVDLLRAGPLDRIKMCDVCCWVFLDVSRNRSRRWCSMNQCGGRDKMRRYRARRRATEGR